MSKNEQTALARSNRPDKETRIDTGASEQFVDDRNAVRDGTPETEQSTLFGAASGERGGSQSGLDDVEESQRETLGHLHKWSQSGLLRPEFSSGNIRITVEGDRRREDTWKVVIKDCEMDGEYTAVGRIEAETADSVARELADGIPPGAVNLDSETNNEFKSRVSGVVSDALEELTSGGLDNYC